MMRVLVTGATGFLGTHVVTALQARSHVVTSLSRNGERTVEDVLVGDLADFDVARRLLSPWRWDAVVNLAGPVTGGTEELATGIDVVTTHARIALHLRHLAGTSRIVHASSMTVYGLPERVDVDEATPRRPSHLYGLAKLVAEDVFLTDPHLDAWILRLPGLFSEERKTGALFHFCRAARTGQPLRVSTPVPTAWNVLHVADAADAITRAVEAPSRAGGAINIAYSGPVDLVRVARMIAELARTEVDVETAPGVEHPPFHLVTRKAATLLAWGPPALIQRLEELYAAYAAT
jgi:nucleoside-diphosphate-sugar epimerase